MRYHCEGFTDRYLEGGEAAVAYNPDDVSKIWLIENGIYTEFTLIESRYREKTLEQVRSIQEEQNRIIRSEAEENLQAKIDLARHIEAIAGLSVPGEQPEVKTIRKARRKERERKHNDFNTILKGRKEAWDEKHDVAW